ncbi:MAG TPA: transaldolase family protein [Gemmatimonadaceae bacterium]|nr:transaldolase family protein [Gemmatimonadaceae bacterium]
MKIYLATASFDDARWAAGCGLLDGLLVAPSMVESSASTAARAVELSRLFAIPVILSLATRDASLLYSEGKEVARECDDVVVDFPLGADTIEELHRATVDGVSVAASMVFTSAQALLAAKAGAAAVLVHIPVLEAQGQTAAAALGEMRRIFDIHRMECEIVAVTPSSAGEVSVCAAAGADAVVLQPSVLRDLLLHPLADRTLDALLAATSSGYHRARFR